MGLMMSIVLEVTLEIRTPNVTLVSTRKGLERLWHVRRLTIFQIFDPSWIDLSNTWKYWVNNVSLTAVPETSASQILWSVRLPFKPKEVLYVRTQGDEDIRPNQICFDASK